MITIPDPTTQTTAERVFSNSDLALQATLGIYASYPAFETNFAPYNSLYTGEASSISTVLNYGYYLNNTLRPDDNNNQNAWKALYNVIYQSNAVIEKLADSPIEDGLKIRFIGEALFMRAYCYFNLVNIWGDVPLLLSTRIDQSSTKTRDLSGEIYKQILADLDKAQTMLSDYPAEERVRASRQSVYALKARAYLQLGEWERAAASANTAIGSTPVPLPLPEDVFIKNSTEAIFQIWSKNGYSTYLTIIPAASPTSIPDVFPNAALPSIFEQGDKRREQWIALRTVDGNSYPLQTKYRLRTTNTTARAEYTMLLRLGEQYLIRAESNIMLGNMSAGLADLNIIRKRAGLEEFGSEIKDEVIAAIRKERERELFFENGLRFFDLKRWGIINEVVGAKKSNWQPYMQLYPIPQGERDKNSALTQNNGY